MGGILWDSGGVLGGILGGDSVPGGEKTEKTENPFCPDWESY